MRIQPSNFNLSDSLRCGYKTGIYNFAPHIHLCTEIALVLEGEINVTVVGNKMTAKANDIIVITPFQSHSFYTPKYCKLWLCVFSNDFLLDFISEYELMQGRDRFIFSPTPQMLEYLKTKLVDSNEEIVKLDNETARNFKAILHTVINEFFSSFEKDNNLILLGQIFFSKSVMFSFPSMYKLIS